MLFESLRKKAEVKFFTSSKDMKLLFHNNLKNATRTAPKRGFYHKILSIYKRGISIIAEESVNCIAISTGKTESYKLSEASKNDDFFF